MGETEKLKKIIEELKSKTPKTVENKYLKLSAQLSELHKDHIEVLKQIRNQPIETMDKLVEYLESIEKSYIKNS